MIEVAKIVGFAFEEPRSELSRIDPFDTRKSRIHAREGMPPDTARLLPLHRQQRCQILPSRDTPKHSLPIPSQIPDLWQALS